MCFGGEPKIKYRANKMVYRKYKLNIDEHIHTQKIELEKGKNTKNTQTHRDTIQLYSQNILTYHKIFDWLNQ